MVSSPQDNDSPRDSRGNSIAGNTALARRRTRRACDKCSSFRTEVEGVKASIANDLLLSRLTFLEEYGHDCNYARCVKKRGRKPLSHRAGLEQEFHHQQQSSTEALSPDTQPRHYSFVGLTQTPAHDGAFQDDENHDDGAYHYHIAHARSTSFDDRNNIHDFRDETVNERDIEIEAQHRSLDQPVRRISQIINPPLPTPALPNDSQQAASLLQRVAAPQPMQQPIEVSRNNDCRYICLEPVLPLLEGIIEPKTACDLLEFYFAEPDSALFRHASPYVLSPVIRKQSLLHPTRPRQTTLALLLTILWTTAQTCDLPLLLLPGRRGQVCEQLRVVAMALVHERDRDHWHRALGGQLLKEELFDSVAFPHRQKGLCMPSETQPPPYQITDDVLTLILITIVVSGGDFKGESLVWWHKAVRLSQSLGLNRQDGACTELDSGCVDPLCKLHGRRSGSISQAEVESDEELRRAFWLIFSLDRHLALSFNGNLLIHDDEVRVYTPLPDDAWEDFDSLSLDILYHRSYGPPTLVTGTGFFEYFLPIMTLLGDVIETHRRSSHPRLGTLNDTAAVNMIEGLLANCAQSINDLATSHDIDKYQNSNAPTGSHFGNPVMTPSTNYSDQDSNLFAASPAAQYQTQPQSNAQPQQRQQYRPRKVRRNQVLLVTSYSSFIVNVLHVLLNGKWDAVSMLSPSSPPSSPSHPSHHHLGSATTVNPSNSNPSMSISNWITSVEFMKCANHSILASEDVEAILSADPELTFMPYLLGIYLLHGSFILLLFADRMPQVGQNESVEKACETIIRAHEVCVVTLSTEFQKRFRKVLRGTLYEVRKNMSGDGELAGAADGGGRSHRGGDAGSGMKQGRDAAIGETEEGRARRSALSLYRWTRGRRGLAL